MFCWPEHPQTVLSIPNTHLLGLSANAMITDIQWASSSHRRWHQHGLVVPVFLSPQSFVLVTWMYLTQVKPTMLYHVLFPTQLCPALQSRRFERGLHASQMNFSGLVTLPSDLVRVKKRDTRLFSPLLRRWGKCLSWNNTLITWVNCTVWTLPEQMEHKLYQV